MNPRQTRFMILALVVATSFVTPFIGAAVNLALPAIAREWNLGAVGMSWVTLSYLLASAVFLVPLGRLADIAGRKKIFFLGSIHLAVSSALCALAPSANAMIVLRIWQGLGSAMVFATGMALVTSVFPPSERGKAIGYNVTAVYTGLAVAPVGGGLIIAAAGWRFLFVPPVLVGLLAAVACRTILGEWAEARGETFDWKGALLYVPAMSLFMFGFSKLPSFPAFATMLCGIVLLAGFVWMEWHHAAPVFNVRLLVSNRLFALANLAALINYATTFAVAFVLSLHLQYIAGMTPQKAGLVLVVQPLIMAVVASRSGRWSDRIDPRVLASTGMTLTTAGLLMLSFLRADTPTTAIVGILCLMGLGFGLFSSPNTNSIMSSVEKKHLGLASGTVGTMRLTGQMVSMGVAAMALHLFMGDAPVHSGNHAAFLRAARTVFALFAAFGVLGVWASWSRGARLASTHEERRPQ